MKLAPLAAAGALLLLIAAAPPPKVDNSLTRRRVFSGDPDYVNVQVSPNGKFLSYIAPSEGVLNVWVAPIDHPEKAEPITAVTDRPIRSHYWAYDGKTILFPKDSGGDENFHLFAVDVTTKAVRDLTDIPKVRAELDNVTSKHPNEISVALNDRDARFHDLYKIDLKTGARKLIEKNEDGYADFTTDDDFNVRYAKKATPDGGFEIMQKKGAKMESFAKIPQEDSLTTAVWSVDAAGKQLFMVDSRDRNTAGIFSVEIKSGKKTLLAEDARVDITTAQFNPKTKVIDAYAINYDRMTWKAVDKSLEGDFAAITKELKGELRIASRSLDDKIWIVTDVLDDGPARIYRYDRPAKKLTFLFVNRKSLEGVELSHMNSVVIKSRDGLDLVSYLTLPAISDPENDGKPDRPIPMVLLVHGGPWGRDLWGFVSTSQWLASRGYAVLQVNFRGSTGFGKKFVNAGDREWAGKMHDDLIDAVDWAVKSGIADAAKVAIYGGSYGGYSTLVGLTFTPDKFACGVDIVGPSNLQTLLASIPPYWAPIFEMFAKRIADPRTDEGKKFLDARSPLTFADRIKKPLLIGQGANDPRVKQAESDQIVKAMQAKKIPVTYVLFSDEGHGFARAPNRFAFDAVAEAFLAQCLGGSYLPINDDFEGSTIAVNAGAEHVVGLAEAMKAKK